LQMPRFYPYLVELKPMFTLEFSLLWILFYPYLVELKQIFDRIDVILEVVSFILT